MGFGATLTSEREQLPYGNFARQVPSSLTFGDRAHQTVARDRTQRRRRDERICLTRAADGSLAARFEKGPVRKSVREHHGTDILPISYYLSTGAYEDDALAVFP